MSAFDNDDKDLIHGLIRNLIMKKKAEDFKRENHEIVGEVLDVCAKGITDGLAEIESK